MKYQIQDTIGEMVINTTFDCRDDAEEFIWGLGLDEERFTVIEK